MTGSRILIVLPVTAAALPSEDRGPGRLHGRGNGTYGAGH